MPTLATKKIHHRISTFITVQLFQLNIKSMKTAYFFMNRHLLGFNVQHAEISFFNIKPAGAIGYYEVLSHQVPILYLYKFVV